MPTQEQIKNYITNNRPTGLELGLWGNACEMPLTDLRVVVINLLNENKIKEYTIGEGEEIEVGYEGIQLNN